MTKIDRDTPYGNPQIGEGGWDSFVLPLIAVCEAHGGNVAQVKEKFGTLRFYYDEPDWNEKPPTEAERNFWDVFALAVDAAERQSARICQNTGAAGSLYTNGKDGTRMWWRTLSPAEAERLGYRGK